MATRELRKLETLNEYQMTREKIYFEKREKEKNRNRAPHMVTFSVDWTLAGGMEKSGPVNRVQNLSMTSIETGDYLNQENILWLEICTKLLVQQGRNE